MNVRDDELFAIFERDPERGFSLIYRLYAGPLLRYVYRFTADQAAAEDLLHDVFAQLLRGGFNAREGADLKAWLFTCAKNASLNFERRRQREVLDSRSVEAALDPQDVETQSGDRRRHDRVTQLAGQLPPELNEAYRLRLEGLDYAAIAEKQGVPLGTVKSRFHRLVAFFQKELKSDDE